MKYLRQRLPEKESANWRKQRAVAIGESILRSIGEKEIKDGSDITVNVSTSDSVDVHFYQDNEWDQSLYFYNSDSENETLFKAKEVAILLHLYCK